VLDRVVYEPFDIRIAPPTWLEPPPGPVNVAPTIALTSPGAGAYFAAPATVLVSADAQDADGGIQLVEFFAGGMPIGTATAAPYTFTWADVPAGEYALTARATDTSGAETTSDPIALVVDPAPPASDIPPQVALTSPATGLTLTAPATATLTADATDPDDGVARVQFFANGVLLGQATTAPYSLTWSDIPAGQYSLTARATDPAGAATTSNAVLLTVDAPPPPPVAPAIDEIVIHAAPAAQIVGGWVVTADSTAASGARLQNPNANAPKVSSPLAAPTQAFDLTFQAEAGKGYRLWLRGKALSNSYSNDSVFVQFAGSVDAAGVPTWRIDSTDGSTVILEDCSGCGLSGWGWADNGYGTNVLGPLVYFAATGPQRLRVQMREDGLGIDQVVLSAVRYLQTPPGAAKNDTTILEATPIVVGPPSNAAPSVSLTAPAEGPPPVAPAPITLRAAASDPDGTITAVEFYAGSNLLARVTDSPFTATWTDVAAGTYSLTARAIDDGGATTTSAPVLFSVAAPPPPPPPAGAPVDEIVLYAAVDAQVLGGWTVVADATAAAGSRLQNPNANLPKVSIASATPAAAFDLTFTADAGKPYRLWLRGKALGDSYSNDSVFVQFDGSVDAAGTPQWRTGTTSSTTVILEECGGCGLQGWGWADNGYGMNVLGPVVYFAETGPQRVRIQLREDGLAIDQVVLSAVAYVTASPGRARSDTVVVPR
jgi:hypothetical protein